MRRTRRIMLVGVIAALSLAFFAAACNDDADGGGTPTAREPAATEPAEETTVDVSLMEFSVNPSESTVAAGTVTFNVSNDGTFTHRFRVIRTDLAPDALPTDAGQADESQLNVIASIADFAAGETRETAATLEPGSYVLICNVVSHYQSGMSVAFTVE